MNIHIVNDSVIIPSCEDLLCHHLHLWLNLMCHHGEPCKLGEVLLFHDTINKQQLLQSAVRCGSVRCRVRCGNVRCGCVRCYFTYSQIKPCN